MYIEVGVYCVYMSLEDDTLQSNYFVLQKSDNTIQCIWVSNAFQEGRMNKMLQKQYTLISLLSL